MFYKNKSNQGNKIFEKRKNEFYADDIKPYYEEAAKYPIANNLEELYKKRNSILFKLGPQFYRHDLKDFDLFGSCKLEIGETGLHFGAHGMTKNTQGELKALDKILTNGIDKNKIFYEGYLSCPKEYSGGMVRGEMLCYSDGPFTLVSPKNSSINKDGIKYVIVNESMAPFIDDLRNIYPNMIFVDIMDSEEFFNNELKSK